jgi:Flp pilus assembly protein protease CpaA
MTKKIFFTVVLLMASASFCLAYDFSAVAPSGQTLYYNIVDGNAEVTHQNGSYPWYTTFPTGNLVIPSSVTNGDSIYNVTSIGNHAFAGCSGLTSVTIPNSVTSIGICAFFECSGMTSVTIPNSVTSIGGWIFCRCSGLTSVTISDSVTSIGASAFSGCSGLTSVTIPSSVTSIGIDAFSGCSGLTSVTIPNSVTSIGHYAFAYCSGLASVTIPNSVTSIGNGAFADCSGLTSVIIPNSVTSIGTYAFYGCSGLTSVTIPSSVTSIGGWTFHGCSGLTIVNFNATNCTNMGIYNNLYSQYMTVFDSCTNLATLNIGANVTQIPDSAFSGCSGLTEINSFAPTAPTLGSDVFNGVSSTIPVYIPCVSLASYQTTWSYFSNIIAQFPNIINVGVTDSTFGVSNVTDGPTCDSAVIEATANYGYHFTQWNDGNTNASRTVIVTADATYTAYFAANEPDTYTITALSANPDMGIVDGSGTYPAGTTVVLTARPFAGYHFLQWQDSDNTNPRTITVTADATYIATFQPDQPEGIDDVASDYSVTALAGRIVSIVGAAGLPVNIYDIVGRHICGTEKATAQCQFTLPHTGVYLVAVGNRPVQRVVVIM